MLGYVLGPLAYKPWYLELHLTLRETVALDTIHPTAMKDTLTQHIRHFFSPGVTADLKSFRERGGTVAEYISINQVVAGTLVDNLNSSSSRRILQSILKPSPTATPPAVTVPHGKIGGQRKEPLGKVKSDKTPKKNLGELKGYCLHWLQHNQMPCLGPKCHSATGKSSLLHKPEWDNCSGDSRGKILAAAKVFSPGVTFKVQP